MPAKSASIFLACLMCASATAQTPSAEVRKFIKFDQPLIALSDVSVIDGTGAPAQEHRTIIVRDGRIEAVTDASVAPPPGAHVIALAGHSVIPGLVGMHNHLMYTASINIDEDGKIPPPGFLVTELAFSAPRLYLAAGVTTMRTTGSIEPYTDLNIARMIEARKIPGPHIDVTGPYLEGKDTFFPQMAILDEREHARKTVRVLGWRRGHLLQGLHEYFGSRARRGHRRGAQARPQDHRPFVRGRLPPGRRAGHRRP